MFYMYVQCTLYALKFEVTVVSVISTYLLNFCKVNFI